jgi:hypothetical protein
MLKPSSRKNLELITNKKQVFKFNDLVVRDHHGRHVKPSCNQFRVGPICKELGLKLPSLEVTIALQSHIDELFSYKIFLDFISILLDKLEAGSIPADETEIATTRLNVQYSERDFQTCYNSLCDRYPQYEKVFTYVKTKRV